MARPKKEQHERRTASVRADLTEAEKVFVQQQAARAGLSEAEYLRRRVLGAPVLAAAAARRADPALVSELNRIGVNVNQLARAHHTGTDFVRFWSEIGRELRAVLTKVVQQGGG